MKTHTILQCTLCGRTGRRLYSGLTDRRYGVPGRWAMRTCDACSLGWLENRPDAEATSSLYVSSYFTHGMPVRPSRPLWKRLKSAWLSLRLGYSGAPPAVLRWAVRLMDALGLPADVARHDVLGVAGPPTGRLLDVGCGRGDFLSRMRALGWNVTGIDPDPHAADTARELYGLRVQVGSIDSGDLEEREAFDVVTLSHVIEHVPDPVETLRRCGQLLRPGGRVVAAAPNAESLGHRLLRGGWCALDPPRHFHHFTRASLRACAERAGLRVDQVGTTARGTYWQWATNRHLLQRRTFSGREPQPGLHHRLEGRAIQILEYVASQVWGGLGEEVFLLARKP